MWLIKASLRNPYMVATLVFMILVLGVVVLQRVPVDILPVFKAPAVQVLTYYPGHAGLLDREDDHQPHRALGQPGARRRAVESKSVPGVSVVQAYFRDDIDPNGALTMTNSLALGTLPTLPPNTLPPVVLPFDPTGTHAAGHPHRQQPDIWTRPTSRTWPASMSATCSARSSGCVAPVVVGGKDRTDPDLPRSRRSWKPATCRRSMWSRPCRTGNLMVTPGTAYFGDNQVLLDTNVDGQQGRRAERPADPHRAGRQRLPARHRRRRRTRTPSRPRASASTASRRSTCRSTASRGPAAWRWPTASRSTVAVHGGTSCREAPAPSSTSSWTSRSTSREAIHSLIHEGIIGAMPGVDHDPDLPGQLAHDADRQHVDPAGDSAARSSACTSTGNTINAMTLGGLALAIGPLVDDAIVVLENTHRNYQPGQVARPGGPRRLRRGDGAGAGGHLHDEHRAGAAGLDAGHGRLPVPAAGPGRHLRHGHVVPAVADLRADDVRQVPARGASRTRGRRWRAVTTAIRRTCPSRLCSAAFIIASKPFWTA